MKKTNYDFIPQPLRLWTPPLIGIPAILLLGFWFPVARFFLFTHHLFWMIGIFLLINPMAETFWPSPASEKSKRKPALPQPSSRARRRAVLQARQHTTTPAPTPTSETPAERLARLQKQKEAIDRDIEQLTTKEKERTP